MPKAAPEVVPEADMRHALHAKMPGARDHGRHLSQQRVASPRTGSQPQHMTMAYTQRSVASTRPRLQECQRRVTAAGIHSSCM
eukprot:NODE_10044_length_1380_cov_10.612929.p4 GENE.NODE_10044_length_1380_cov_10.612929~~NODE_10044_length_1380_cov_10.612929.p4  ORF type:complete len:83 (+),score=6.53 NODE_10044_length_1380_cov_10.612929:516-764(+)